MVRGGFRHLVVLEHGEVAGILSVRDIVRCWSGERANTDELVG
jgi:signal-transduction protein with cAMP-binding, CBS, and nucleotidyltransferase domain